MKQIFKLGLVGKYLLKKQSCYLHCLGISQTARWDGLFVRKVLGVYSIYLFIVMFYLISDTLWVEITVESEMTMALVEQLAALPVPSSRREDAVTQVRE